MAIASRRNRTKRKARQRDGRHRPGAGIHDVQWEEVTPLPVTWFVPLSEAAAAVTEWIEDEALSDSVNWSDQTA